MTVLRMMLAAGAALLAGILVDAAKAEIDGGAPTQQAMIGTN